MFDKYVDLAGLKFGAPAVSGRLCMVPVYFDSAQGEPWQTLSEAMSAGSAVVTEVSENGSVPQLLFKNAGEAPILLLDGEELIGAKQNRILNLSILAPAKREITIPVSCVERGRWSWRSREFSASDRTIYAKLRARKAEHVSFSMSRGEGRRSDQSAIWADIAEKSTALYALSETSASSALYETTADDVGRVLASLKLDTAQAGAVFLVNGRFAGVEIFGAAATFAKVFGKIVRGYALDCVEEVSTGRPVGQDRPEDAETWFRSLMQAEPEHHPAVGLGEDLRIVTPSASGGALVAGGKLVHLYAFSRHYAAGNDHWADH